MIIDTEHLEDTVFEYFDKVKMLLSTELWQNLLLNCTKNELFTIILIYRKGQVNMTQIAENIQVPLNTATGIIARMEKKGIVNRTRSLEDKRVVTIELTEEGKNYFKEILGEFFHYGQILMECCDAEDLQRLTKLLDRFVIALTTDKQKENEQQQEKTQSKVRKIQID